MFVVYFKAKIAIKTHTLTIRCTHVYNGRFKRTLCRGNVNFKNAV